MKGTNRSGKGGEEAAIICDPGSELQLGGREKKGEDNKQDEEKKNGTYAGNGLRRPPGCPLEALGWGSGGPPGALGALPWGRTSPPARGVGPHHALQLVVREPNAYLFIHSAATPADKTTSSAGPVCTSKRTGRNVIVGPCTHSHLAHPPASSARPPHPDRYTSTAPNNTTISTVEVLL